jgi:hypothetical protein
MRPALLLLTLVAAPAWSQKTNPDSLILQDFQNRVADYVKLQKQVAATFPAVKQTLSPEKIGHHERELADRLRKARPGAAQGNVFTPQIAAEFRRLIGMAMQGSDSTHVQQSLKHAEPVKLVLKIGAPWSGAVPLQSTPPTLLMNLPTLDPAVDYRVVGNSLVLRDTKANTIVDFLTNALPSTL